MKAFLAALLIFAMPQTSAASFLFEPYAGFPWGTWRNQRTTSSYDMQVRGYTIGLGYGARFLYTTKHLFAGVDYTQWLVQWKFNKVPTNSMDDGWRDVTGVHKTLGPTIGYIGDKQDYFVWLTYFLQNDLKLDSDIDPDMSAPQYFGAGYGFGFGMKFLKTFKLNIEYQLHTFDKWINNGTEVPLPGTGSGVNQKTIRYEVYVATIGIPISFW